MTVLRRPYALPRKLEPGPARVLTYWQTLKRGEAAMPFADDVNLSAVPRLAPRLMLIEVLGRPVRLRCGFGVVGADIKRQYGDDLDGKFLDEIEPRHPLQFFESQASATIESSAPTLYQHAGAKRSGGRVRPGYSRLLLPMWGDDHIGMLLGAFAWLRSR
jgi:hypothetical protein